MLRVDPDERLSASEALQHDWFSSMPKVESEMTMSIYESFKNFKTKNLFQKEALRLMVKHIPEENLEKLKNLFFELDTSRSGVVKVEDLVFSMNKLESMNEREIKELISAMDSNKTGFIYYSEFISAAMITKKEIIEESLWLTFKQLDIDNKGELTEESLKRSIEAIGKNFTNEQLRAIIETVNSAGGVITFTSFKEIVLGSNTQNLEILGV